MNIKYEEVRGRRVIDVGLISEDSILGYNVVGDSTIRIDRWRRDAFDTFRGRSLAFDYVVSKRCSSLSEAKAIVQRIKEVTDV